MNWGAVWAIARKDAFIALRTRAVVLPLIIVPLVLMVGVPVLVGLISGMAAQLDVASTDMEEIARALPPGFGEQYAGLSEVQAGYIYFIVYLFAPMYLARRSARRWRRSSIRQLPTVNCSLPRSSAPGFPACWSGWVALLPTSSWPTP